MITGEPITISTRTTLDALLPTGEHKTRTTVEATTGILTDSGQSTPGDAERPTGTHLTRVLYISRAWTVRSLKGATITTGDGTAWHVVGDPKPTTGGGMTPTGFHPMAVTITREED